MTDQNSLQPLIRISTDVEEAQTKLDLVNFCIKAQQDLSHKLRKEVQRRRETCSFIRNNNLQLESEIRCAEQQIKSILIAHDTIKNANVALKKELLLAEHNNSELIQRMETGEKRFEELWLQSKARYESIPFVQKWLQMAKKTESLKNNLNALGHDATILQLSIKKRQHYIQESDRKQIIRLAEFLVREMPMNLKLIKEKSAAIASLVIEVENMKRASVIKTAPKVKKSSENVSDVKDSRTDDKWLALSNDELMMPMLRLASSDLDVLSFKLELNKAFNVQTAVKNTEDSDFASAKSTNKPQVEKTPSNDYISPYFNNPVPADNVESFSQKKLINILDDIQLDKNEAYDIVSKVNPVQLMEVNEIAAGSEKSNATEKVVGPMESDEIEEIDLTKTSSQNILLPPTQFVDLTQENVMSSTQQNVQVIVHMDMAVDKPQPIQNTLQQLKNSQEKKKVSFNIPTAMDEAMDDGNIEESDMSTGNVTNLDETITSVKEVDMSAADESFLKIKDMILKKHHLDLSPQFVYGKNMTLLKKIDEGNVTSKFFDIAKEKSGIERQHNEPDKVVEKIVDAPNANKKIESPVEDAVIEEARSSPKSAPDKPAPVAGLLFTHGTQNIPESLNVSMSTTGFEDGDAEYGHILDNSLLLSPKGDMLGNDNNFDGTSQELPNFLSGIKKTGLFFFGQQQAKDTNTESNAPASNQENAFTFNFGSQEKKKGLFSFFR